MLAPLRAGHRRSGKYWPPLFCVVLQLWTRPQSAVGRSAAQRSAITVERVRLEGSS
jgi:hypothetical protein